MVPAWGFPPNIPVTTMTGSKIAKSTSAAMALQINSFLTVSITVKLVALARTIADLPVSP
jgi:hypothetical protein